MLLPLWLLLLPPVRAEAPPDAPAAPAAALRLRFFQSQRERRRRSHYDLLIRPSDHPAALTAIWLEWPESFDGQVLVATLRLCRMDAPPRVSRTRCAAVLPARVEPAGPRALRIVPERPLAGDGVYGLSLLAFNPSLDGFYPLRLRASLASDGPEMSESAEPVELGVWRLAIGGDGE